MKSIQVNLSDLQFLKTINQGKVIVTVRRHYMPEFLLVEK